VEERGLLALCVATREPADQRTIGYWASLRHEQTHALELALWMKQKPVKRTEVMLSSVGCLLFSSDKSRYFSSRADKL
jgi:hypothetical protein